MLSSLRNTPFKSHRCNHPGYFIGIDQLGIAKYFRPLTEQHFDFIIVHFDLIDKFFRIFKGSQRVCIRFGKELYASCLCQVPHTIYKFRYINLELFQCNSGNRKRGFKFPVRVLNHFQQSIVCRNIRTVSYTAHNLFIIKIVIVIMIVAYIKETITFQTERLMNLKTDGFHIMLFFISD